MFSLLSKCPKNPFSIFKTKCQTIDRHNYTSLQQLYTHLNAFEFNLSYLEKLKMPKKLQDFNRRFNRLQRADTLPFLPLPLQLTHTFHYFCLRTNERLFGPQKLEVKASLNEIQELTSHMIKYELNPYLQLLLPKVEQEKALFDTYDQRFKTIQERVSRKIFDAYYRMSQNASRVSFLQQRQYKGDFKFKLVSDIDTVVQCINVIYHCALFGQVRSKMVLAAELAITELWQKVPADTLRKLLFVLAMAGRSLKSVEKDLLEIADKVKDHPLEMAFYLGVSGIEDQILLEEISKQAIQPRNRQESVIAEAVRFLFSKKFSIELMINQNDEFKYSRDSTEAQTFFENFLTRFNYEFGSQPGEPLSIKVYTIQGRHFLCLDHSLINRQILKPNGLCLLQQDYHKYTSLGAKYMNWPRMAQMDKRGLREEYILSKFKGMERPVRKRYRYYEY